MNDSAETITHIVVMNHEEQYSIWQAYRDLPAGWTPTGFSGSKDECLGHIGTVWIDMRPLSLRREMDAAALEAMAKG